MTSLPDAQLSHLGLNVRDMRAMVDFYTRMLGMQIVDSGVMGGRELTFLTRSADEQHQLVMATDPAGTRPGLSAVLQISFRLRTLEDLRTYHAFLAREKVNGLEGRDHGNSWSLYFFDPEDNKIELYVATPWYVSQPWRAPLDLADSAEAIFAQTAKRMKDNPTSRPVADWEADMRKRLGA